MIPVPVACWLFNKDLGESAGQYKDTIGGLTLASGDGLDHPASAAKIGAGAVAGNNDSTGVLTGVFSGWSFTGGGTISLWARAADAGTSALDHVLEYLTGLSNAFRIRQQISSTLGRRYGLYINSQTPVYESYVAADTNWHHVLVTIGIPQLVDPEDPGLGYYQSVTLYVDGVARLVTGILISNETSGLRISGGESGYYLNGDVDAVHFWDVVLSFDQIAEVYNSGSGWEYAPATSGNSLTSILGQQQLVLQVPWKLQ